MEVKMGSDEKAQGRVMWPRAYFSDSQATTRIAAAWGLAPSFKHGGHWDGCPGQQWWWVESQGQQFQKEAWFISILSMLKGSISAPRGSHKGMNQAPGAMMLCSLGHSCCSH